MPTDEERIEQELHVVELEPNGGVPEPAQPRHAPSARRNDRDELLALGLRIGVEIEELAIAARHPEAGLGGTDLSEDVEHDTHLVGRSRGHELLPVMADHLLTEERLGGIIGLEDKGLGVVPDSRPLGLSHQRRLSPSVDR